MYKHYATLYFVFIFDSSENELAMLDLIQGMFYNFCYLLKIMHHFKSLYIEEIYQVSLPQKIDASEH